jgi:hypothetical protein
MATSLAGVKPAIASSSIWGSLLSLFAGIVSAVPSLISDPTVLAVIPHAVVPWIGVAGAVVSIIGRATADTKIKGVVSSS